MTPARLPRLRSYEWLILLFFVYVAAISPWFWQGRRLWSYPLLLACGVFVLLSVLTYGEELEDRTHVFRVTRDWLPLVLTLVAYREMDWFTPTVRDYHLELRWIDWDRILLYRWGFEQWIEGFGRVIPTYLEFCYLLVYAVGPFAVFALYILKRKQAVLNAVLFLYELGTLGAYALFPYFPSDPPRVVFGASDLPHPEPVLRSINLWLLGGYGIHSSVFPSAHVSSAFSAAWGLLLFVPDKKWLGRGMLIYAVSISIAVIYGRYHYATDCVAGFGVSLLALAAGLVLRRKEECFR